MDISQPELNESLWLAWVERGRRGDASRVRRWRVLGSAAVAVVLGGTAVYWSLLRV